ncbi:radical SAM protein [Paraliomyxa miuraensis]|uniref:radical SAM protein n=1 Tax=Paraliomyxa miuraensis TaxID=376150 RepID=UPI002257C858|nr:radical SAM protein [Paraliomyxa miuraensis]MCX4243626.1 radical SAM protein [Paraliomyxa miuraensis]
MNQVLVVHPPLTVARDFIDYPYLTNLGALQVGASLRRAMQQAGGSVRIVDAFCLPDSGLSWRPDGRAHVGAPVATVVDACSRPDEGAPAPRWSHIVVAYTPFHRPPHRDDVLGAVLHQLRSRFPEATIILADCYQSGQHYVECEGREVLRSHPEVDHWVKYEGEVSVPDLVLRGADRPAVILGQRPEELDALPFPAWDAVDLGHYQRFHERFVARLGRGPWAFPIDGRTLPLVTSRGCPFTCLHCSSNPDRLHGAPKTQRRYSGPYLARYVEFLARECGATRLAALDELVNVRKRHFEAFLEAIEAHDLRFDVPNGMRADYLERGHLERMRGRVATVSVSAESGSRRVIDEVVGKRLDLETIRDAARNAHEVGVPLMIHYMIGLPSETAVEVNETLAFALELLDEYGAHPAVQFATPLPGTPLARGRSLPVVEDWGPRFQMAPSPMGIQSDDQRGSGLDRETLERFMWTFRERVQATLAPHKLIMNVTYVCNNHCTFCAVGTRTQIQGHPTRQREHLVKWRRRGVRMVDFDGGEPTLNPELVPLIRVARSLGYDRVNVTTNGRRCYYEEYAKELVRSGLTTLLFSVHGPDARTHAQQVGVAEAFEQTVRGIEHCVRHAPEAVELGMNVTLTKGNYRKLGALVELGLQLGLPWLNIQFLTPFGRATRMVAPDTEDAARVAIEVIDEYRDRVKFQVINLPFCFMPNHTELLQGDLAKLSRQMVFVNNETVNLGEYLAARRTRKPQCASCPHACFCGGFYELDRVPEPPWIIAAEDLVRPIDDPRRHESVPAGFHDRVAAELAGPKPE